MKVKFTTILFVLTCLIYSCEKENQTLATPTFEMSEEEIDGITYKCITIGDQIWMAENLKTRLDGGRADGCMTFGEPIITLSSKESLETKQSVRDKLLEQYNNGLFNIDSDVNAQAYDFIQNELIRYFFNNNIYSWTQYEALNITTYWAWYFDPVAVDLVRYEVARLFEEEKLIILFAAADQNYIKDHGYLYTYEASQKVIPEGWRIPTDEDWMKLERAMGMSEEDIQKADVWRGDIGRLLKADPNVENFNATLGGTYIYGVSQYSENFKNKDLRGYWWTSTKDVTATSDSTYYIRSLRFDNDQMLRGTTRLGTAHSIRLVKDK